MNPASAQPRPERVPYLDGLRGLAVLLVVAGHYFHQPGTSLPPDSGLGRLLHLLGATWVGVDLFFVLSGFLLGGILMDHRASPNLFRIFYWRRACRILPAYLAFLSPLAIAYFLNVAEKYPAWNTHLSTGAAPPWSFPLFVQNIMLSLKGSWGEAWISPTWSLAVEEQFYLIIPLLIRFVAPQRLPAVLLALILSAPVFRVLLTVFAPEAQARVASYMLLPCRWDTLLLGVMAAWAIREPSARAWLERHVAGFRAGTAVLLAGCVALAVYSPVLHSLPMRIGGYSLFALLFAAVVICGHLDVLPGRRVLEGSWLRSVGRVSYALYLIHVPISCLFFYLIAGRGRTMHSAFDVALMAGSFVTALTVAHLSWRLMERPILNYARSFRYQVASAPVARPSGGERCWPTQTGVAPRAVPSAGQTVRANDTPVPVVVRPLIPEPVNPGPLPARTSRERTEG